MSKPLHTLENHFLFIITPVIILQLYHKFPLSSRVISGKITAALKTSNCGDEKLDYLHLSSREKSSDREKPKSFVIYTPEIIIVVQ